MGNGRSRVFSVLLATGVLVGAANLAYAASGGDFHLGDKNKAKDTSVLKNVGNGPALSLVNGGGPSLKVSSSDKVSKLHADRLDGFEGRQLASVATDFKDTNTTSQRDGRITWAFPMPAGDYSMTVSATLNPVEETPAGGYVSCYATARGVTTQAVAPWITDEFADPNTTLNFTSVVSLTETTEVYFNCEPSDSLGTAFKLAGSGLHIVMTRLTSTETGPLESFGGCPRGIAKRRC